MLHARRISDIIGRSGRHRRSPTMSVISRVSRKTSNAAKMANGLANFIFLINWMIIFADNSRCNAPRTSPVFGAIVVAAPWISLAALAVFIGV